MKISEIKIGNRTRKDLGDIDSLVRSIQRVGLLHPIVVSGEGRLIAGFRRIKAFERIGRMEIPHRTVMSIEEATLALEAERDENFQRKNFTPSEMAALAERLEPLEKKAAKERQKEAGKDRGKGKIASGKFTEAKTGESGDRVARAVGVSRPTLRKIQAVTQAAKNDPKRYRSLAKEMDETGKVDRVFKKVAKLQAEELGPIPKEYAKNSPERKWTKSIHQIWVTLNSIKSIGGPTKLVAKWGPRDRERYLNELRYLANEINKWISALEKEVA